MIAAMDNIVDPLIQTIISALLAAGLMGFVNPSFFMSYCYGSSVSIFGNIMVIKCFLMILERKCSIQLLLISSQALFLFVYGIRLITFVITRNKNANYKKARGSEIIFKASFPLKIIMWILFEGIYFCYCVPILISLNSVVHSGNFNTMFHFLGLAIMLLGFLMEVIGDIQKTKSKELNPDIFCSTGLYSYVRMPNYFGEMIFWIGNFISCIGDSMNLWMLICSIFGVITTTSIMIMAAKGLDLKQQKKYGTIPAYIEYRKTVPVFIPFIHLYSMNRSIKSD